MPEISIIMPVWIDLPDKSAWLIEAIESVIMQNVQNWELIIIDDCSPFEPSEAKWRYRDDSRIRWFKTAYNSGPALARNTAVGLAESDCILPLDSDDMLGTDDTLQKMLLAWYDDKTRIVYGNLQQYTRSGDGHFERSKLFTLADYTFERAMNLGGVMPVTAMHSKECHRRAGGWKAIIEAGLEDVEYWLAAGKAGFCGYKVNATTLVYRRQEESRAYKLKHGTMTLPSRQGEMEALIKELHKDVYEGRFPMGCCGGGNSRQSTPSPVIQNQGARAANTVVAEGPVTGLKNKYRDDELVWVQYQGKRQASWSIIGRRTKEDYRIMRFGHKLQVHVDDLQIFKQSGRGQDFLVGIPDPTLATDIPPTQPLPAQSAPAVFEAPRPEVATIERLDKRAAVAQGLELPRTPEKQSASLPPSKILDEGIETTKSVEQHFDKIESLIKQDIKEKADSPAPGLGELNLGNLESTLLLEDWTVAKLANAQMDELIVYSGIGQKRAEAIINKAQALLKNET